MWGRRDPDGRQTVVRATIEEISLLRRPRFEDTWVLPWSRALEDRIGELDLEAHREREVQEIRECDTGRETHWKKFSS
jgi:hypothetical protein